MIKFTYKLKLNERVHAKCSKHPQYNPEKHGRGRIIGACSGCFSLFDLWQAKVELDKAVRQFQRHAAPWSRPRQPRKQKTTQPTDSPEQKEADHA